MSCCNQGRCGECKCRQAIGQDELEQHTKNAEAIALVLAIVLVIWLAGTLAVELLWPLLRGIN